jgi:hypothetical protein
MQGHDNTERVPCGEEHLLQNEVTQRNKEIIDSVLGDGHAGTPRTLHPRRAEIKAMLQRDSQWLPWSKVSVLAAIFVWLVITEVAKEAIRCGGVLYCLLAASVVPFALTAMFIVRRWLIRKQELCNEVCLSWIFC